MGVTAYRLLVEGLVVGAAPKATAEEMTHTGISQEMKVDELGPKAQEMVSMTSIENLMSL